MMENAQSEHHTYLMTGYILNTLSTEEKAEFEQCLQETPALGYELQQLQEVMGLLAHTVPQTTAPDQLRNKVLSVANAPATSSRAVKLPQWRWGSIATGIAALLILGLGLQNHLLLQRLVQLEEEEEHQAVVSFTLKNLDTSRQSGTILLDLEAGRAIFAFQNLAPLKPDEVYSLWAFTGEKTILCGTFTSPQSGQIVTQIAIPLDEYGEPVTEMKVFRGPAAFPADLRNSIPVLSSQI